MTRAAFASCLLGLLACASKPNPETRESTTSEVGPTAPATKVGVRTGPIPAGDATARTENKGKTGLTSDEVQAVVKANRHEIDACYAQYLERTAPRSGLVELGIEIHAEGRVHNPQVLRDDFGDAALASCIKAHMSSWQFPNWRGDGVMRVNLPFALNPPAR